MKNLVHIIIKPSIKKSIAETLWQMSGYLEKLRAFGIEPIVLDPALRIWPEGLKAIRSLNQLPITAGEILICVEDSQVFFDPEIVLSGVEKFKSHNGVYFTQWEHCRLPVGVGIRAYDASILGVSKASTFTELQEYLFKNKESLRVLYDDTIYVNYEKSILDSRGLKIKEKISWNLEGFLHFSEKETVSAYKPDTGAPYTDDRGMEAAYGFESISCGNFPTYVMFDMTNKCNAKCIHCPHSIGFSGSQEPEFISLDSYKRVIDQCVGRNLDFVRITADGEPLLHPKIWQLLDYARDKGVGPIGLTTNGSALNEKNAKKLLESKIFMIDFSLDAFFETTFKVVRAGLSYQKTLKNVLRLIDMRNAANSELKIVVSFVRQNENIKELEAFIDYWEPRVDKVLIREMHTNVGVNTKSIESISKPMRYPCPHLFRRTIADYSGDFKFCPIDWEGDSKLGRLSEKSIFKNWHDPSYHNYRLQHLNNEFDSQSICADCEDWRSTPWNIGYEKIIKEMTILDTKNSGSKT